MHCLLCERPAADAYLCGRCSVDFADRLGQLPGLYTALGGMLAPVRAADGSGRSATAAEAPLPLRPDVVDIRAGFGILPTWARALADDRRLPELTSTRRGASAPDDLGHRVRAACTALAAAVPWIAARWPAAGDCAREVRDLYDGARSVVGAADLPARMGRCPAVVGGSRCGAELLLPQGQQVLRCAWCGATYPAGTWGLLKIEQARAISPGASAAVAAGHPSRG